MAFCAAAKTPAGTSAEDSKEELRDAADEARNPPAPPSGASNSGGVIGEISVDVEEKALLL